MRGPPITEQDRADVARLHAAGLGRNAIMREIGRSGRIVSAIAKELGLSFARGKQVKEATEAKKADAASRRARLQVDMLAAAEKLLGQMFSPAKVYNFGGKENTYEEQLHDEPPFSDKRAIAAALTQLVQSSTRLAEFDRGAGDQEMQSALVDLMTSLKRAWREGDHAPPADPEEASE